MAKESLTDEKVLDDNKIKAIDDKVYNMINNEPQESLEEMRERFATETTLDEMRERFTERFAIETTDKIDNGKAAPVLVDKRSMKFLSGPPPKSEWPTATLFTREINGIQYIKIDNKWHLLTPMETVPNGVGKIDTYELDPLTISQFGVVKEGNFYRHKCCENIAPQLRCNVCYGWFCAACATLPDGYVSEPDYMDAVYSGEEYNCPYCDGNHTGIGEIDDKLVEFRENKMIDNGTRDRLMRNI